MRTCFVAILLDAGRTARNGSQYRNRDKRRLASFSRESSGEADVDRFLIEGDFLVERTEFLQFQLHARISRFITAYEFRQKAKAAEPTKPIESFSISASEARFAVLMADSACASVRTASVSKPSPLPE
jgi:hypothetical protein